MASNNETIADIVAQIRAAAHNRVCRAVKAYKESEMRNETRRA